MYIVIGTSLMDPSDNDALWLYVRPVIPGMGPPPIEALCSLSRPFGSIKLGWKITGIYDYREAGRSDIPCEGTGYSIRLHRT